jgi:hypothetical protein
MRKKLVRMKQRQQFDDVVLCRGLLACMVMSGLIEVAPELIDGAMPIELGRDLMGLWVQPARVALLRVVQDMPALPSGPQA